MAVKVSIRGPVLALRQELDQQAEKLLETTATNSALRARIARFERQEQVLHEALLSAEQSLGSSQFEGSNLHQQVAALRETAEAAAAAQRQSQARADELSQKLTKVENENVKMKADVQETKAALSASLTKLADLRAELTAERQRVRIVVAAITCSCLQARPLLQANTQAKTDSASITELRKMLNKQQIMNQELLSTIAQREHHISLLQKVRVQIAIHAHSR